MSRRPGLITAKVRVRQLSFRKLSFRASPRQNQTQATDAEFRELSEDEKRLVRVYRQFPSVEAKNMLLAFEMRYKQLYDFFLKYANTPQK
ncbi:helix-turn-helix domain-containing protein [Enterobacter asburiae]|uniref:Helix-turn-helix domain-containing protein n=1 Tax=Enterobacter asburiae TaxID=61645 RepID=A0A376FD45_ENTAS|nr:helix-turn-helix domain-containing protein [Enterobacter asburiae]